MPQEATQVIEELKKQFHDFKEVHEKELAEVKAKGHADPLLKEQVDRILKEQEKTEEILERLQEFEKRAGRPGQGQSEEEIEKNALEQQHAKAFEQYFRKGKSDGLRELEEKALNVGTPEDGGHTVPEVIDRRIVEYLLDYSQLRKLFYVQTVSTPDTKELVDIDGTGSGWVAEDDARTATNTPQMKQVEIPHGEIYAFPQATQRMLDDSFLNVAEWLARKVRRKFDYEEAVAFLTGNGTDKPKGLLAYTTAALADGSRTFGQIEHLATGVSGGFAADDPADAFYDLMDLLKEGYEPNAKFLMHRRTKTAIKKFKDGEGNYLYQNSLADGTPQKLFGYDVVLCPQMPLIGANSLSIAFGDFKEAYYIRDIFGTRVLRDEYTNKPYVGFYTTKRVGGGLVNDEAIKFLKFSAS